MSYVDGFVLPLPRKKVAAYRRMAAKAGRPKRMTYGGFKAVVEA